MPIQLQPDDFMELVEQALASVPEGFRQYMENLSVEVQPLPTPKLLREMHIRGRTTLLGVYHGVPLTRKSVDAPIDWPERIVLFQKNIEAFCDSPEEVVEQIRKTVLHEVGHHFGMDEDDLDELGYR